MRSVLLNERTDLRDDVLELSLGQASCGLRFSLLDGRAGEPRDVGDSVKFTGGGLSFLQPRGRTLSVADFGREATFYLGRVPLARFRALSGRRGGGPGKLDALAATVAFATRAFAVSRADSNFKRTSRPLSR
jgi:hypothetical protein